MRAPALALLALAACVGSYSRAVEETRAGLVGLSGRELRRCLGAPTQVDLVGDVEQQSYRFERWQESSFSASDPWDPRPGPGGMGAATRAEYPSFCQLDFELRGGAVAAVRAHARDMQGMNADAACLLEARRCLPYEDE
jgi:hypothetical protein